MKALFASMLFVSAWSTDGASAQTVISAQDGKQVLVDGRQTVPQVPAHDNIVLIDVSDPHRLRISATLAVATSIIGPPSSVAVTPNGQWALVTAARRVDPAHPDRLIPDDRLTVIDLRGDCPRIAARLHAGPGASGIAINPDGTLALVANRSDGSVSVFRIAMTGVVPLYSLRIGDKASSPAQPIFFDNGRLALVSRDGDHQIAILDIDGERVIARSATIAPGLRPYGLAYGGRGEYAVSANIGGHARDMDTISLIALGGAMPHAVDVVSVGLTPEGIAMDRSGTFVALNVNDGSDTPPNSEFYKPHGRLQIWRIEDGRLHAVTSAATGHWGQGVSWMPDGSGLLVQDAVERTITYFGFDGKTLERGGEIVLPASPAAMAVIP